MLFHARCSGHRDELPRMLLRDDDVCPPENVERRGRVRFREDCVAEGIAQPEARYGHAKLVVKTGCVSAQRLRAMIGTYNGGCNYVIAVAPDISCHRPPIASPLLHSACLKLQNCLPRFHRSPGFSALITFLRRRRPPMHHVY